MYGYIWIFMDMDIYIHLPIKGSLGGHQLFLTNLYVNIHVYVFVCMDIYGCIWIFMDIYIYTSPHTRQPG
jgi:hypothetical protein